MITYRNKTYKIGMCCSFENYKNALEFDYVELPMTEIMQWDINQLENVKKTMKNILIANKLFPSDMQLIGNTANEENIMTYAQEAILKANYLGIKIIVFGSGRSRSYSRDYSKTAAWKRLMSLICRVADFAKKNEILIAIEPLARETSNLLNTLQESYDFIESCNHSSVKLVGDAYHMKKVGDNPKDLYKYKNHLLHFHLCTSERGLPGTIEENECEYFDGLMGVDSVRTISIEANLTGCENYSSTLNYLKKKIQGV